jgi:signal recognition particle subunit SRP54
MQHDITLDDFRKQLKQLRLMCDSGEFKSILTRAVGKILGKAEVDPRKHLRRMETMINAMTAEERRDPDLIDQARQEQIAAGCGAKVSDVRQLLDQFKAVRKQVRRMWDTSLWPLRVWTTKPDESWDLG